MESTGCTLSVRAANKGLTGEACLQEGNGSFEPDALGRVWEDSKARGIGRTHKPQCIKDAQLVYHKVNICQGEISVLVGDS